MSAVLPPMVKHAIAVGHMSKGRVVKGIEQTWCRAMENSLQMWRLLSSTPVLGIALQPLYFTLLSYDLASFSQVAGVVLRTLHAHNLRYPI